MESASVSMKPPYSLWQMVGHMTKLGMFGFGGLVALVGYMHRYLVEKRKWIGVAQDCL
jgi:chromate transporter